MSPFSAKMTSIPSEGIVRSSAENLFLGSVDLPDGNGWNRAPAQASVRTSQDQYSPYDSQMAIADKGFPDKSKAVAK